MIATKAKSLADKSNFKVISHTEFIQICLIACNSHQAVMELLQEKVILYVSDLFKQYSSSDLFFHNFVHTLNVVERSDEILEHVDLSASERSVVIIAAWFHDTGHLFNLMRAHEQKSVEIMNDFLLQQACSRELIEDVASCIMATRMPTNPSNLKQKVLCDADTYHLGTDDFLTTDKLIKLELEHREGIPVDNWDIRTLAFLTSHSFYTSYCKTKLGKGKNRNIAWLYDKINNSNQYW